MYGGVRQTLGVTTTAATTGTLVEADAVADTKGDWTDVLTTTYDWQSFDVVFSNVELADFVVDIGYLVDEDVYQVIAPDLRVAGSVAARNGVTMYRLPLHVPAGKDIVFRCADGTGAGTLYASLYGHTEGAGYSRMVALYTPVAGSKGVVVDPGGTANTKGSYAQLVASSSARVVALTAHVGTNGEATRAAPQTAAIDIGIGGTAGAAVAAQRVLLSNLLVSADATGVSWQPNVFGPFPVDLAAATRFAARAQCDVNTADERTMDVALWGFVP
jgi:hypothetical protein